MAISSGVESVLPANLLNRIDSCLGGVGEPQVGIPLRRLSNAQQTPNCSILVRAGNPNFISP